jgi:hypothetical protein
MVGPAREALNVKVTEKTRKPCLHERRGIVLHLYFVEISRPKEEF